MLDPDPDPQCWEKKDDERQAKCNRKKLRIQGNGLWRGKCEQRSNRHSTKQKAKVERTAQEKNNKGHI